MIRPLIAVQIILSILTALSYHFGQEYEKMANLLWGIFAVVLVTVLIVWEIMDSKGTDRPQDGEETRT